ncbi:MAG: DUF4403 family protein [Okeania sp. SIO1H6]|nr:DUF4403 family protein [Okeania sp. SIO1H6]
MIFVVGIIIFSSRVAFAETYFPPKIPEFTSANILQSEPSESILNLPVKIPLANIQEILNLNIRKTFSDEKADPIDLLSNDNLTYEINRKYLSIGTKSKQLKP